MQLPINIGLHRSRFLDCSLIAIALLASGSILVFPCSPVLQGGLLLVVGFLLLRAWRALSPPVSAIWLERAGNILVADAGGAEFVEAVLLPRATVYPWLTVFRLEPAGARPRTVVIAGDSTRAEDFRRLRVFLRWRAQFSAAGDSRGASCS